MELIMKDALVTKKESKVFTNDKGQKFDYNTITILNDGKTMDFTADKEFDINQLEENNTYDFECSFNYRKLRIANIA